MSRLFKLSNRDLMRILLCLISTITGLSDPRVGVGICILGFAVVMIDYFRQAIFKKQECDFWMLGETLLGDRVSLADFVYGILIMLMVFYVCGNSIPTIVFFMVGFLFCYCLIIWVFTHDKYSEQMRKSLSNVWFFSMMLIPLWGLTIMACRNWAELLVCIAISITLFSMGVWPLVSDDDDFQFDEEEEECEPEEMEEK
ncbi:hypothetical protein HG471_000970 [Candidatus Saccharibacteria bacterium]|nr:hypothetical protein [Candidatus Saccharibacteria bacterium]